MNLRDMRIEEIEEIISDFETQKEMNALITEIDSVMLSWKSHPSLPRALTAIPSLPSAWTLTCSLPSADPSTGSVRTTPTVYLGLHWK